MEDLSHKLYCRGIAEKLTQHVKMEKIYMLQAAVRHLLTRLLHKSVRPPLDSQRFQGANGLQQLIFQLFINIH
jgi:hypothetical protein